MVSVKENFLARKYYAAAVLLASILFLFYLLLPLITFARAQRLLQSAVYQQIEPASPFCFQPSPPNQTDKMQEVLAMLEVVEKRLPRSGQFYLHSARAHCLAGDYPGAVQAYSVYTELKPANPLGKIERGFALGMQCIAQDDQTDSESDSLLICSDKVLLSQIRSDWQSAGLALEDFLVNAEYAWKNEQHLETYRWTAGATWFSEDIPAAYQFLWGVAAVLSGREIPSIISKEIIPVYVFSPGIRISGSEFRWLAEARRQGREYGTPLSDFPTSLPSIGALWWEGRAVIIVQVEKEGFYDLNWHLRYSGSDQGLVMPEVNFAVANTWTLEDQWKEYSFAAHLAAGTHILSIHYPVDNGDVFIDWVEINQQP